MISNNNIAEKIKLARLKKNLSQTELAKVTGISNSLISNIECGSRSVGLKHILILSKVLDINIDDFLNVEKEEDKRPIFLDKNIKLLRQANGWSQGDLSKITGLTVESISHYENGQQPGAKVISRLCEAFCIDPDSLIYDDKIDMASSAIKRCLLDQGVDLYNIDEIKSAKEIIGLAYQIAKINK